MVTARSTSHGAGYQDVWTAASSFSCIQLQLRASDFGFLFSGLKLEGVEGPFCRKEPLCEEDPELPDGQWNETVIICKGGHVTATVNGVLVNETQCEASEGYIGFQSEGGAIEYRDIYVKF